MNHLAFHWSWRSFWDRNNVYKVADIWMLKYTHLTIEIKHTSFCLQHGMASCIVHHAKESGDGVLVSIFATGADGVLMPRACSILGPSVITAIPKTTGHPQDISL